MLSLSFYRESYISYYEVKPLNLYFVKEYFIMDVKDLYMENSEWLEQKAKVVELERHLAALKVLVKKCEHAREIAEIELSGIERDIREEYNMEENSGGNLFELFCGMIEAFDPCMDDYLYILDMKNEVPYCRRCLFPPCQ